MNNLLYTTYGITILLFILLCYKTYTFLSSAFYKSFSKWFYFSRYSIEASRTKINAQAKRLQNKLSIVILITAIIDLLVFVCYTNTK